MKRNGFRMPVALALALASFAASAGTKAFTYQGVLKDAKGNRLEEKNHVIEFRIYDQATGGVPVWGRRIPVLLDDDGLFAAELSGTTNDVVQLIDGIPDTALPAVFVANAGTTLYIGLTVAGSGGEILPRQKFLAAPYASYAADTSAASGGMAVSNEVSAANANVTDSLKATGISITNGASFVSVKVGGAVLADNGTIPLGGIITWSGSENAIPYGWALCNGQTANGRRTPDLRSRFIAGAGTGGLYSTGDTGGEASHTLSTAEMPRHSHGYKIQTVGYMLSYNSTPEALTYDSSPRDNGIRDVTSNSTGEWQPHENRPPFYALCYIMRVM